MAVPLISVTFHGWQADDRLPEIVEIDGVPMRIVNGVLAHPDEAARREAAERDSEREKFIEAILATVSRAGEEVKADV